MADYIDMMAGPGGPRVSRWDRGGPATIQALDELLVRAGLRGRLEPAKQLLSQAEGLFSLARRSKEDAAHRLEQARRGLRTDEPAAAAAAIEQAIIKTGPWLSGDAPAMGALMGEGHALEGNATQVTFALVPDLYRQLSMVAAEVVAEVAAVPVLPNSVWAAPTSGLASTAAIRAGREAEWSRLVRLGVRWDDVHAAGQLLRESGVLQGELLFPAGCPEHLGVVFLNWQPALEGGLEQVNRMAAPLRIRACVDRGYRPGLWLKADHERELAAAAPGQGCFPGWSGRGRSPRRKSRWADDDQHRRRRGGHGSPP